MNRSRVPSNAFVIYTLPALVIFSAILLTLGFIVLIGSALAGAHLSESQRHLNPFTDYEALWPGQPDTNIGQFARLAVGDHIPCVSSSTSQTGFAPFMAGQDIFCSFVVQGAPFQMVSVSAHDSEIQELRLFSNELSQDDLYLYWGVPDAIQMTADHLQVELERDRRSYSATVIIDIADSIVKTVTLTAK